MAAVDSDPSLYEWAGIGRTIGGPSHYTDHLGGYRTMLDHHRNLEISGEQRFRFASLMSRADAEVAGASSRLIVPGPEV